jgi:tetratricopeptide (TPR) repeat protein
MMNPMRTIAAIFAILVIIASPVAARQDDPRLDALFAQLLSAADSDQAHALEMSIWRIWTEAGDADLDQFMTFGIGAMRAGQFGPALNSFNAIINADPAFAEGWNKRATLYFYMGRYDDSISDVERTLALELRHFGALSGMGLIHTELDDEATALEWFEYALQVNPHMPYILQRVDELRTRLQGEPI